MVLTKLNLGISTVVCIGLLASAIGGTLAISGTAQDAKSPARGDGPLVADPVGPRAGPATTGSEPKTTSARKLEGAWRLVEWEAKGKKHHPDEPEIWRIRENEIDIRYEIFRERQMKFKLPSSKAAGEVDFISSYQPGKTFTHACLYTLTDKRLRIAWSSFKEPRKRPTNFTPSPESDLMVWTFERILEDPGQAEADHAFASIFMDWLEAVQSYFASLGTVKTSEQRRKLEAERSRQLDRMTERSLQLAEAKPNTAAALAALCTAAINAPDTERGKKAQSILENGRIARAGLGELWKALRAANSSMLLRKKPAVLNTLVLQRVKQELDQPEAARILAFLSVEYRFDESSQAPRVFAEAADLILEHFSESPDITNFCFCLGNDLGSPPWCRKYEKHLRTILEKNRHKNVRKNALFALASVVQSAGQARQDEAAELYERFIKEFGRSDDPRSSARSSGQADFEDGLVRRAKAELDEIGKRGLGKPAPELVGEDLDGRPLKLADFRGKVVLLSFWSTTCGSCMRLVPHERALLDRLRNKPFAIVGVNGDDDPEALRRNLAKREITWRSFKDKRPGKTAIMDEWKIAGLPTLYLIDQKGILRKRWTSAPSTTELDQEINRLLK